jgi:hypothetical protein
MMSFLVFNIVYRMEIQSVMLEFSTPLVNCCPSRFRTYKVATPPQTKTPVKTTFRDWCLYSSFVHPVGTSSKMKAFCRRCNHSSSSERRKSKREGQDTSVSDIDQLTDRPIKLGTHRSGTHRHDIMWIRAQNISMYVTTFVTFT